jgi:hypothetical protein
LPERLFGAVRQIENATRIALGAAPFLTLLTWTARLHVLDLDVLLDAPEIAGVPAVHLHLDGLGEHLVEGTRPGGVNENPAVAALAGKPVLDLEPIVPVGLRRQQVTWRLPEADELAVADDEAVRGARVAVPGGNVGLPPGEVRAVEQRRRPIGDNHLVTRGREERESTGQQD